MADEEDLVAGERQVGARHRHLGQVGAGEHGQHARRRAGGVGVDADARVWVRAQDQPGVGQGRQGQVGGEAEAAFDLDLTFEPALRSSDDRV